MEATRKNMIGEMLEQSVRATATQQAQAEVNNIEVLIAAELEKIGLQPHATSLWQFTDGIAAKRADRLVQDKMSTIVSGLLGNDQAAPACSKAVEGLAQSISPGDTLVLRYPGMLTREQRVTIEDYARANMAPGCHVLVLVGGVQLETVLKAPSPAAEQPKQETISTLVVKVDASELDALSANCDQVRAGMAALEKAGAAFAANMAAPFASLAASLENVTGASNGR